MLKKDVDYIYIIKGKGYLNGKGEVSTMDLDDSKHFVEEKSVAELGAPIALDNIFYDFGKWTLTDSSKIELERLIDILKENPNIVIELGAHTDYIGNEMANQILSQKRAQSVVDFLIKKGIHPDRLTAKGYGETLPQKVTYKIANNSSFEEGQILTEEFIEALSAEDEEKTKALKEEARQINRRTEFRVISTRYIPEID
jgi:peptidoglycan-associated lipoprotein